MSGNGISMCEKLPEDSENRGHVPNNV